jgi:MFS transporter, DHA2 family, multidrug resistance protein
MHYFISISYQSIQYQILEISKLRMYVLRVLQAGSPKAWLFLQGAPAPAPPLRLAAFHEHGLHFAGLALAMGAEMFLSAAIAVALPDIAGSFGASADEASWVMTVYLVGFTVFLPLSAFLADALGQRLYIAISTIAFMASATGCAFSQSLATMLVWRGIQGAAGAAFLVRYYVSVPGRLLPRSRRIGLFFACIPFAIRGFGPVVGGYLTESLSWRWVFVASVPLAGLALLALCFASDPWPRQRHPVPDVPGLVLLACGLGSICTLLVRGEIDDWLGQGAMALLVIVGLAALPLFIWRQHHPSNRNPLFSLHSLAHRGVWPGLLFAGLFGFATQAGLYLIPQYLRSLGRNDAISSGLVFTFDSASTAMLLVVVTAGMAFIHSRVWLFLAGAAFACAMAMIAIDLTSQPVNEALYLPLVLRGFTLAACIYPLPDMTLRHVVNVSADYLAEARASYEMLRQLGAAAGVATVSYLLDYYQAFHTTQLSEHLTALDGAASGARQFVGRQLAARGVAPAQLGSATQAAIHKVMLREASALAFENVFWVLAFVGVAMCVVTLLFARKKPLATRIEAPNEWC